MLIENKYQHSKKVQLSSPQNIIPKKQKIVTIQNIATIPNIVTIPNIITSPNIAAINTNRHMVESQEENLVKKVQKIHLKKIVHMQTFDYINQGFNQKKQFSSRVFSQIRPTSPDEDNNLNLYQEKWDIINKVKLINRFLQKVRNQTSDLNFVSLKKRHFDLIGDKAYYFLEKTTQNLRKRKISILTKINVFDPEFYLIVQWKYIYMVILIFELIMVPYQISFKTLNNNAFNIVPLIAYSIDIILQFNTGYYEDDIKQLGRQKIFQNYKKQFLIEIIVIICYIISIIVDFPVIKVFFYLKSRQIYNIQQDIIERYSIKQRFSHAYRLTSLPLMVIYVAHICGCIFHLISINEISKNNNQTWLVDQGIDQAGNEVKYLNGLYFSIITMITVGYGDIKPIAIPEKVFIIFMTLLGSLLFAYTVNTIGSIFQELAQKEADFNQKKYELSVYMRTRQIGIDIQVRVMKYVEYIKGQQEDNPIKGEEILNSLSNNLKQEIKIDFYGRILKSSKLFNLQFSNEFLQELSLHFKEKVCGPGEIIYSQGSIEEYNIYFIQKGNVELIISQGQSQNQIQTIQQGRFFGEKEFFDCTIRDNTAKSLKETHLLILNQSNFLRTLKYHPNDFEKYCQIKDSMQFYNTNQNISCFSCGKYNHFISNCHFLHFKKSKELFLTRHTYSVPCTQRLKRNKAQQKKYFRAMLDNDQIKLKLKQLRIKCLDLSYEIDLYTTDKTFYFDTPKIKLDNEQIRQVYTDSDEEDVSEESEGFSDSSLKSNEMKASNIQLNSITEEERKENKKSKSQLLILPDKNFKYKNSFSPPQKQLNSPNLKSNEIISLNLIQEESEFEDIKNRFDFEENSFKHIEIEANKNTQQNLLKNRQKFKQIQLGNRRTIERSSSQKQIKFISKEQVKSKFPRNYRNNNLKADLQFNFGTNISEKQLLQENTICNSPNLVYSDRLKSPRGRSRNNSNYSKINKKNSINDELFFQKIQEIINKNDKINNFQQLKARRQSQFQQQSQQQGQIVQLFQFDFEYLKEFEYYFKHNNASHVIKNIKYKQKFKKFYFNRQKTRKNV